MIAWIDNASFEDLFRKWRHAPLGDPFFSDVEVATHFEDVMQAKRKEINDAEYTATSKKIGW